MPVLPPNFLASLHGIEGFDKKRFIQTHEQGNAVTSIRLNPLKPTPAIDDLPIENFVPWCEQGRYLSARPSFTLDPVFHGGAYYVQEASSMFLHHVLQTICKISDAPKRVLDLCGAPGGKSTLLASALPNSFVVANEVIKTRVGILAENITKWGCENVIVTNNDPKDFKKLPGYFDLMVIDAPCSGSGLFRKDPDAISEWSEANVQMCSHRQQRILADTIGSLKQHGYLVYSTCSYSREEDEDICDWIADTFQLSPVAIPIDSSWNIVETFSAKHTIPAYRFYPDKVKGEGFFIACFQQENPVDEFYGYHNTLKDTSRQKRETISPFLNNPSQFTLNDQKELIIATPKKWEEEFANLSHILHPRKSGIAIGTIKGKDFIPHHELALSSLLSSEIAMVILSKEDALRYLKRQVFSVDIDKKGWAVCSYQHIHLGWIKVLPNRVNNYYPTDWRILKD